MDRIERRNQDLDQIVEAGEFGGLPLEIRGGEVAYSQDEGSEEQTTGGRKREVLDLDARDGPAEAVIGGNRFRLEQGSRLTIETNVVEPSVTRTEKPKIFFTQRAVEVKPQLYSGRAVKHFRILSIPLFQTGKYEFDKRTFEEIQAWQRDGWETPYVKIEG